MQIEWESANQIKVVQEVALLSASRPRLHPPRPGLLWITSHPIPSHPTCPCIDTGDGDWRQHSRGDRRFGRFCSDHISILQASDLTSDRQYDIGQHHHQQNLGPICRCRLYLNNGEPLCPVTLSQPRRPHQEGPSWLPLLWEPTVNGTSIMECPLVRPAFRNCPFEIHPPEKAPIS